MKKILLFVSLTARIYIEEFNRIGGGATHTSTRIQISRVHIYYLPHTHTNTHGLAAIYIQNDKYARHLNINIVFTIFD